ncbi:M20 family metallopeptidase [Paenibacillus eucommiae]|uniref:Succinyl-diaminopimelate desuccinylase n=1 Tax=Paenibacillus eucommiae TaxID=1355755 RepID=A0ABS4J922_9BACL|nr:M20 family metallopeptidase [Paenibacillus eucommiae]MBP1996347.1 succinyl-diaminopimelate desuccinylase [Paenibacillus eucommiae]
MRELLDKLDINRLVRNTLRLVDVESVTGNTVQVAAVYQEMLEDVGCTVERYEFIPNNPTLVATYDGGKPGKTILFNGHMDVVPLAHAPSRIENGRIYGRGTNDMKGSLACIIEVLQILRENNISFPGKIMMIANSLHESPGGRGEDLIALTEQVAIKADAAVVMEGATYDCTIAQLGSATFVIHIKRDGEPSHQLHTAPGTPHPISVAAEIVSKLNEMNKVLEQQYIEDIGFASYFVGALNSGQFYNQFPNVAVMEGVRRYAPEAQYSDVLSEMEAALREIADRNQIQIELDMKKVRDGYRLDKNDASVTALTNAIQTVRGIEAPLVGKKLVTDAGILANALSIPVLCSGPDQRTAHGDVEYVEISELELTTKVYIEFISELVNN